MQKLESSGKLITAPEPAVVARCRMTRLVIVLFVLAAATAACGFGHDTVVFDSARMESLAGGGTQFGANVDEVMWWWNVSFADVKDSPDWQPGEEPPLSTAQAIRLAQQDLTKYTDTPRLFEVDNVQLLQIGPCCRDGDRRKWIYLIDFERQERFPSGARGTMRIPVLLDGRVIEGKKESPGATAPR